MASNEPQIHPQYDSPKAYDGRYPPDWDARKQVVLRRDDYTCRNCTVKSGPYGDATSPRLHVHHIVPLSDGGSNRLSNLSTLCEACHNDAHDHDITADLSNDTKSNNSDGLLVTLEKKFGALVRTVLYYTLLPLLGMLGYLQLLDIADSFTPLLEYGATAGILLVAIGVAVTLPTLSLISYVEFTAILVWGEWTTEEAVLYSDFSMTPHSLFIAAIEVLVVFLPFFVAIFASLSHFDTNPKQSPANDT